MTSEYSCIFAISSPHPLLTSGHYNITYNTDTSLVVVSSKGGRVYWFCFSRMDRVYASHELPRFSLQDAEDHVRLHASLGVIPGRKVTLADLWETRETAHMTALEEAFYDHWSWGRFVCIGDSVHKTTPNLGSGGMSAIEDVAALADALNSLYEQHKDEKCGIQLPAVHDALAGFQRNQEDRMRVLSNRAGLLTRVQAMRGPSERFFVNNLLPHLGNEFNNEATEWFVGTPHISFLPIPARSLSGTMPFNPRQGFGRNDTLSQRFVKALPLLLVAVFAFVISVKSTATVNTSLVSTASSSLVSDFAILYAMMLFEGSRRIHSWAPFRL